jgi:hypothetical protein
LPLCCLPLHCSPPLFASSLVSSFTFPAALHLPSPFASPSRPIRCPSPAVMHTPSHMHSAPPLHVFIASQHTSFATMSCADSAPSTGRCLLIGPYAFRLATHVLAASISLLHPIHSTSSHSPLLTNHPLPLPHISRVLHSRLPFSINSIPAPACVFSISTTSSHSATTQHTSYAEATPCNLWNPGYLITTPF